jgi:hypothetical protein
MMHDYWQFFDRCLPSYEARATVHVGWPLLPHMMEISTMKWSKAALDAISEKLVELGHENSYGTLVAQRDLIVEACQSQGEKRDCPFSPAQLSVVSDMAELFGNHSQNSQAWEKHGKLPKRPKGSRSGVEADNPFG